MSWSDLAAIPETYYTAYGSLLNLKIKPSDRVLVRAATSGVGIAFAKLVKAQFPDIKLVGSCRDRRKVTSLTEIGYEEVLLEKDGKLETTLVFDKILELVGPATIKDSLAYLSDGGILCQTGQLGGQWYLQDFDPIDQLRHNVYLTTFYSGNVDLEKMQALFTYIDRYHVPCQPDKIFPFPEVAKAHAYLESKEAFGKVVLVND